MQIDGILWPPIKGIQDGEYKLIRTINALEVLQNPHHELKNVIHIGGTNGKGSNVSFIKNILNAHGFSSNIYTSPHLVKVNERFQINSQDISDEKLETYTKEVYYKLKERSLEDSLTYFEALTVLAFYIFSKEKADFNIIEVGLGGRFDATNVLNNTLISVITSISLDHQDYLGNTHELIAGEKAEIIKRNSMVAVGMQTKNSIYQIFENKAETVNAKIEFCKNLQNISSEIDISYQKQNANLSLLAIEMIGKKLGINFEQEKSINAILQTKWKGRLEKLYIKQIEKEITIDCAHNIDGIFQFLQYISHQKHGVLIIAMLKRKFTNEIATLLHNFLNANNGFQIITTNFEDIDECKMAEEFETDVNHQNCLPSQNVQEAFNFAQDCENIFLCGSIHFVGFVIQNYSRSLSSSL